MQTSPSSNNSLSNGSGAVVTENLPDYSQFFRDGRYSIFSINADGTGLKEIANYNKERDQISVSPDGRKILYVEYTEDLNKDGLVNSQDFMSSEIGMMNIDGSEATILVPSPEIDTNPSFSPDGKFIIFSSSRDTGYRYLNLDLYLLEMGKNEASRFTETMREAETNPAWIGNTIIYSNFDIRSTGENAKLVYMDEDGSKTKVLTNPDIPSSDIDHRFGDYDAQISPDGTKIVFARYLDTLLSHRNLELGDYDLYLTNFDGTELVNISNNLQADLNPSFAPDSTKIVFCRKDEKTSELFLYDLDTKDISQIKIPNWNTLKSHPTFGPEGRIYFVGERL